MKPSLVRGRGSALMGDDDSAQQNCLQHGSRGRHVFWGGGSPCFS